MIKPQFFKIHQIVIDDHLSDLINKEGWKCHVKAVAYTDALVHGDVKVGIMHDCYDHVATILADDLNHVFEVGNIGPEDRIEHINDSVRSLSVGDIIEDEDGNCSVVDKVGFTPLAPSFHRLLGVS